MRYFSCPAWSPSGNEFEVRKKSCDSSYSLFNVKLRRRKTTQEDIRVIVITGNFAFSCRIFLFSLLLWPFVLSELPWLVCFSFHSGHSCRSSWASSLLPCLRTSFELERLCGRLRDQMWRKAWDER